MLYTIKFTEHSQVPHEIMYKFKHLVLGCTARKQEAKLASHPSTLTPKPVFVTSALYCLTE